jgi:hypothetical protein
VKIWILLIILIFLFACAPAAQNPDLISVEELEQLESVKEKLVNQYQPDRETYPIGTVQVSVMENGVEKRVTKSFKVTDLLKNLCPLPDDFWKYKYLMASGRITQKQLGNLDECYYTQPEWYGNDFADIALKRYTNPDLTHWTPEGYGNYPHETILYSKPGEIHNLYTFFGASWIVEQYQGIGLKVIYPTSVRSDSGKTIGINPQSSSKYITASINPVNVLLAPAYVMFEAPSDGNNQIDSCEDNACWRRKINFTITVDDNTPPGTYGIGFDVTPVDSFYRAKWTEKYQERFAAGNMLVKPSEEMFKVTIIVS